MATSPNYGWPEPDNTDLVKNGALAIRTLGNAIDTTMATMVPKSIVDAKGDLIAGTAADTAARLAVGNNGETLVADSSATQGLRYNPPVGSLANPLINAGFDIAQRGTSTTVSGTITYTLDRWLGRTSGAGGSVIISRETTGDTTNLPNIQYCARSRRATGSSDTSQLELSQAIETTNSIPFVGKTITFSYYARKSANLTGSFIGVLYYGTGTDQQRPAAFTGATAAVISSPTLSTTWTRYAVTATIPVTATQIGVMFRHTPTGTAGSDDYYEVTGVQLDIGTWTASTAPTFRRAGGNIAGELVACQRYYWRFQRDVAQFGLMANTGYASTATVARFALTLPSSMRVAPTSLETSNIAANRALTDTRYTSGTWALVGSTSAFGNSVVEVSYTHGSAVFAAGDVVNIQSTNTTTQYIALSAEL